MNHYSITDMVPASMTGDRPWAQSHSQAVVPFTPRPPSPFRPTPMPRRPELEPPDRRTWYGARRYSPAVAAHNQRLRDTYFTGVRADYAQQLLVGLEYHGVARGLHAIAGMETLYWHYATPGSLCESLGGAMLLGAADRVHAGIAAINARAGAAIIGNI